MVAWAGLEMLACGFTFPLDTAPRARWPLQDLGDPRHLLGAQSGEVPGALCAPSQ